MYNESMKKLLLLLSLTVFITGCCSQLDKTPYPKFAMDQVVEIVSGFYRGHQGIIVEYHNCIDRDTHKDIICYDILQLDEMHASHFYKLVNEKDLR
jgi:hypothetical protein